MSRLKDLTGKKFGKWTVIRSARRNSRFQAQSKCLCVCGARRAVVNYSLTSGQSRGCRACCKKFKNILGKKYGKLTVVHYLGKSAGRADAMWEASCECGNTSRVRGSALRRREVRSCGKCTAKPLTARAGINRAYGSHLANAKTRGIKSYLKRDEFEAITQNPCVYCGGFSTRERKSQARLWKRAESLMFVCNSVDRRDNEPYYKLSNSQSTCIECNIAKMALTDAEFRALIVRIAKYCRLKVA